jgi:hypothetical protein
MYTVVIPDDNVKLDNHYAVYNSYIETYAHILLTHIRIKQMGSSKYLESACTLCFLRKQISCANPVFIQFSDPIPTSSYFDS